MGPSLKCRFGTGKGLVATQTVAVWKCPCSSRVETSDAGSALVPVTPLKSFLMQFWRNILPLGTTMASLKRGGGVGGRRTSTKVKWKHTAPAAFRFNSSSCQRLAAKTCCMELQRVKSRQVILASCQFPSSLTEVCSIYCTTGGSSGTHFSFLACMEVNNTSRTWQTVRRSLVTIFLIPLFFQVF